MAKKQSKLVAAKDGLGYQSSLLTQPSIPSLWVAHPKRNQSQQLNLNPVLPKVNRLKRRQDFTAVYKYGTRRSDGTLTSIAKRHTQEGTKDSPPSSPKSSNRSNQGGQPTRIGISISQKVSKKAVVRNRIKRQIRAAWRSLLPRISEGWDIVVVVKPPATQCNYRQFLQKLEQLLAQVEGLNGN
jgi:ribonuclease P protein component